MNRHEVRYIFEHRLLPKWFFEESTQFIGILLKDEEFLYNVIGDIFKKEEVENPYTKEEFHVEAFKITDDVMIIKIEFPQPEDDPLCYRSYMFFDETFEKVSYFCIEKGNEDGDKEAFVCAWTPEGEHYNYGICSFENQEDLIRCLDIHMEEKYGMTREKEV